MIGRLRRGGRVVFLVVATAQPALVERARAEKAIDGGELPDWIQAATGTSSRLDAGCEGLAVELELSGHGRANHLNLHVANDGRGEVTLLFDTVTAAFSGGRVRQLLSREHPDWRDQLIQPNGSSSTVFTFPEKADFAGQSALTIEATFARGTDRCVVRSSFRRDERLPESPFTTVERSIFTFDFGFGVTFGHHGKLAALAPSVAPFLEGGGNFFPSVHHGVTLGLLVTGWAERAVAMSPEPNADGVTAVGVLAGYARRFFPLRRVEASLEPAVGVARADVMSGASVLRSSDPFFLARVRTRVLVALGPTPFYLGATVAYLRYVGGRFGAAAVDGGQLGGTLVLGMHL